MSADDERLAEIEEWFRDRGIDLWFDQLGNQWLGLMLRSDVDVGAADVGRGRTKLEAAEDAQRRYPKSPKVYYRSMEDTVARIDDSTAGRQAEVSGIASEEAFGMPTVVQLQAVDLPKLKEVATDYGWQIAFIDEPGGTVRYYVADRDRGEILQSGLADDLDDAKLDAMMNLWPPSEEARGG